MIVIALLLIGLCLGSFINAVAWRFHEQDLTKSKKLKRRLSIIHGRSMCPNCKHELSAKDLVPVLSWIELRGKCRYCQKSISYQYPLVEVIIAFLFVASYIFWPYNFSLMGWLLFATWLVVVVFFMILIVYDIRWMLLPNKIVYPLIAVIILNLGLQAGFSRQLSPLYAGAWGVISLAGLFYLLFQLSDGKWIGGGDVKLAIGLGLLVGGPTKSLLLLFVASSLGTLIAIPGLIKGTKNYSSRMPFGPFLILGAVIVYLWGSRLITLYTKHLFHI